MKKISEMELDELREFALGQQSQIELLEEDKKKATADLDELRATNLLLQRRNNDLFLRVEQQQATPPEEDTPEEEEQPQSCEEFALNNLKGIIK